MRCWIPVSVKYCQLVRREALSSGKPHIVGGSSRLILRETVSFVPPEERN